MDAKGNRDIALGLHLVRHPFLDIHMWPLISSIKFNDKPILGTFGLWGGRSVQRHSLYGVVEFTSDNQSALDMVQLMKTHCCPMYEPGLEVNFGAHRVDIQQLQKTSMPTIAGLSCGSGARPASPQ